MHYILWCEGPLHICSSEPCHLHNQAQSGTGYKLHLTDPPLSIDHTSQHCWQFCLQKYPYFLFPVKYFEQMHGAAMGSPESAPTVSNLFIVRAWNQEPSALPPTLQSLWLWYVDDTFFSQRAEHQHPVSTAYQLHWPSHIEFILQILQTLYGSLPFLDTSVFIRTTQHLCLLQFYRKLTYMQSSFFNGTATSNLYAKYSMFNTLTHRAIGSLYQHSIYFTRKMEHIKGVLLRCKLLQIDPK